jgi:hypothetical protein
LCFNNEIEKIPIEFVTSKQSKMFVDIKVRKIDHKMRVVRLCISKNFYFSEQQFKDALTHEMIHVLLAQKNVFDYGGQHGLYFKQEMRRINNLNIGIKVGLFDDENIKGIGIRDELKGSQSKKTFYIYLQKTIRGDGVKKYNLTPFSKKENLLEFWKIKLDNLEYVLNMREYKDNKYDVCIGETNLSDIDNFPVSRLVKTARLFVIEEDKYNKIKENTEIYETKSL